MIWKKLVMSDDRIVTSAEIKRMAKGIGKVADRALYYLQEEGYIVRILKGIFYVRTPDEKMRNGLNASIFELVGMALDHKGEKCWYFSLETALDLNGMTHEYCDIAYVFCERYRTTRPITIIDSRFKFIRKDDRFFGFGMLSEKNYSYSDPERTILDLIYRNHLQGMAGKEMVEPLVEYGQGIDMDRFHEYLAHYPRRFVGILERSL